MGYGLDGNGLLLQLRQPFMDALKPHVDDRKVQPLKPYIFSIDHKLNVARYCAGVIWSIAVEDFIFHRYGTTSSTGKCTSAEYSQRCIYYAHDWDQFSLGLLFSIESFAAAAFSLFDTCGHLLIVMYDLDLPRKENRPVSGSPGESKVVNVDATFVNAVADLKSRGAENMYEFLHQYQPGHDQSVSWIGPLKRLRNHTTHADVTDIVELAAPTPPHRESIRLQRKPLEPLDPKEDLEVREFAKKCFDGLEDFVEHLYSRLSVQVEKEKNIPISGKFDNEL